MGILLRLEDVIGLFRGEGLQSVEIDEPQNEERKSDPQHPDNVIRLPRDWIGPREDLVPLELDPVEAPPSANAFWDEMSHEVQEALQATSSATGSDAVVSVRATEAAQPHHATHPLAWTGRGVGAGSRLSLTAALRSILALATLQGFRPSGRQAAVAAAVVACLAVVVGGLEAPAQLHLASVSGRGGGAHVAVSMGPAIPNADSVRIPPSLTASRTPAAAHERSAGRQPSVHRAARHKPANSIGSNGSSAAHSTPTSYVVPASSDASGSTSVSASYTPSASTPSPSSAEGSVASTASSSASSNSAPPAGPTGPGAPFGPGHIG